MNQDRFQEIPKDVRELILYDVDPQNLDALCFLNDEMRILCNDERILDKYISIHNLEIPDEFYELDIDDFIDKMVNTNSYILLNDFINKTLERVDGIPLDIIISHIIETILSNKNISDEMITQLFYFVEITDYDWIDDLTEKSVVNNRQEVIDWLKIRDLFNYSYALIGSILINDNKLYDRLNIIVSRSKIKLDYQYQRLINAGLKAKNLYVLNKILSDKNNPEILRAISDPYMLKVWTENYSIDDMPIKNEIMDLFDKYKYSYQQN